MREGIGSVFLYNIIILFVIIVFGILSATISYYKAFKVNERILYSIDKFEGYNQLSRDEINEYLESIGYTTSNSNQRECAQERDQGRLIRDSNPHYLYCVYYYEDDRSTTDNERNKVTSDNRQQPIYYNYSVTSYIYVDLPIVGQFKLPVYTKGERIYNFSDNQRQGDRA